MNTDAFPDTSILSLHLVLEGDEIDIYDRVSDGAAVNRGEKIFMEVFQKASDFEVVFELPHDREALRYLLETGKYCRFHRRFEDVLAEPLDQEPNRTSYAHDGMFGVLDLPDDWAAAELPADWPDSFTDPDAFVWDGGCAAVAKCVRKATLKYDDASMDVWEPVEKVSIRDLVDHWPIVGRG